MRAKRDKFLDNFMAPPPNPDKVLNNESELETAERKHYGYKSKASTGSGARNTIAAGTDIAARISNAVRRGNISARPTSKQRGTSLSKNKLSRVMNSPQPGKHSYKSGTSPQTKVPRKTILKSKSMRFSAADGIDEDMSIIDKLKSGREYVDKEISELVKLTDIPLTGHGDIKEVKLADSDIFGLGLRGAAKDQAYALYALAAGEIPNQTPIFGQEIAAYITAFSKARKAIYDERVKNNTLQLRGVNPRTGKPYPGGKQFLDIRDEDYQDPTDPTKGINPMMRRLSLAMVNSEKYQKTPIVKLLFPPYPSAFTATISDRVTAGMGFVSKPTGGKSELIEHISIALVGANAPDADKDDSPVAEKKRRYLTWIVNKYNEANGKATGKINFDEVKGNIQAIVNSNTFDEAVNFIEAQRDKASESDLSPREVISNADSVGEAMGVLTWMSSGSMFGVETPNLRNYMQILNSDEYTDAMKPGRSAFEDEYFRRRIEEFYKGAVAEIDEKLKDNFGEPGMNELLRSFIKTNLIPPPFVKRDNGEEFKPFMPAFIKIFTNEALNEDSLIHQLTKYPEAVKSRDENYANPEVARKRLEGYTNEEIGQYALDQDILQLDKERINEIYKKVGITRKDMPFYDDPTIRFLVGSVARRRKREEDPDLADEKFDISLTDEFEDKTDGDFSFYKQIMREKGYLVYTQGEEEAALKETRANGLTPIPIPPPRVAMIDAVGFKEANAFWRRLMLAFDPDKMSESQRTRFNDIAKKTELAIQMTGGNTHTYRFFAAYDATAKGMYADTGNEIVFPEHIINMTGDWYKAQTESRKYEVLTNWQNYLAPILEVNSKEGPITIMNNDILDNLQSFLSTVKQRFTKEYTPDEEGDWPDWDENGIFQIQGKVVKEYEKYLEKESAMLARVMHDKENGVKALSTQLFLMRLEQPYTINEFTAQEDIAKKEQADMLEQRIDDMKRKIFEKRVEIASYIFKKMSEDGLLNTALHKVYVGQEFKDLMSFSKAAVEELTTASPQMDPTLTKMNEVYKSAREITVNDQQESEIRIHDNAKAVLASLVKSGTHEALQMPKTDEQIAQLNEGEKQEYLKTMEDSKKALDEIREQQKILPLELRIPERYLSQGIESPTSETGLKDRIACGELWKKRDATVSQLKENLPKTLATRISSNLYTYALLRKLFPAPDINPAGAYNTKNKGHNITEKEMEDNVGLYLALLDGVPPVSTKSETLGQKKARYARYKYWQNDDVIGRPKEDDPIMKVVADYLNDIGENGKLSDDEKMSPVDLQKKVNRISNVLARKVNGLPRLIQNSLRTKAEMLVKDHYKDETLDVGPTRSGSRINVNNLSDTATSMRKKRTAESEFLSYLSLLGDVTAGKNPYQSFTQWKEDTERKEYDDLYDNMEKACTQDALDLARDHVLRYAPSIFGKQSNIASYQVAIEEDSDKGVIYENILADGTRTAVGELVPDISVDRESGKENRRYVIVPFINGESQSKDKGAPMPENRFLAQLMVLKNYRNKSIEEISDAMTQIESLPQGINTNGRNKDEALILRLLEAQKTNPAMLQQRLNNSKFEDSSEQVRLQMLLRNVMAIRGTDVAPGYDRGIKNIEKTVGTPFGPRTKKIVEDNAVVDYSLLGQLMGKAVNLNQLEGKRELYLNLNRMVGGNPKAEMESRDIQLAMAEHLGLDFTKYPELRVPSDVPWQAPIKEEETDDPAVVKFMAEIVKKHAENKNIPATKEEIKEQALYMKGQDEQYQKEAQEKEIQDVLGRKRKAPIQPKIPPLTRVETRTIRPKPSTEESEKKPTEETPESVPVTSKHERNKQEVESDWDKRSYHGSGKYVDFKSKKSSSTISTSEYQDTIDAFMDKQMILETATHGNTASGNRFKARMRRHKTQALLATQGGEGSGHGNLSRLGIVHPVTSLHNFMRTGQGGSDKLRRLGPRYQLSRFIRDLRIDDPAARNNKPVEMGFEKQRGSVAGQNPFIAMMTQLGMRKTVYDGNLIDR